MIWPLPRWTISWTCSACGTQSREYQISPWCPLWVLVDLARDGWRGHAGGRLCRSCGDAKGIPGETEQVTAMVINLEDYLP